MLYRSTDCLSRCGAPVEYLPFAAFPTMLRIAGTLGCSAHNASFHLLVNDAPSANTGTRCSALVASLKAGHVAPSTMLRKLAAYERQNQIDIALQEIGKVERTLFMLDWLESPELRRRCQAGLNKSEQRHLLTQRYARSAKAG